MQEHPTSDLAWVGEELQQLDLKDRRLEQRARKLLGDFFCQPGSAIPQACGDWAGSKAAYRFFANERVHSEALLESHGQATVERMRLHRVILAVQDTSWINYSTHPCTAGLGPIGGRRQTQGLLLHSTLALTPEGQCLGVLDTQLEARGPLRSARERKATINRKPVEEKESVKWLRGFEAARACVEELPLQNQIVSVCDREGDLYELLLLGQQHRGRADVLVRAMCKRRVSGEERFLWQLVAEEAPLGQQKVKLPRRPGRAAQEVSLEIRCREVQLPPPQDKARYLGKREPLRVWAIEARQVLPKAAREPICWRLLTTIPTKDLTQACEKVAWYTQRWQIEIFHKILKSGCRIEARQLESAARLRRALALDLIVAWRILALSRQGRLTPDQPCASVLSEAEWKILYCSIHPGKSVPVQPPRMDEAVKWIARLGGFLSRKGDGFPGPITLWRGLQRLHDLCSGSAIANQLHDFVGNA
jgi:hypothetical protein